MKRKKAAFISSLFLVVGLLGWVGKGVVNAYTNEHEAVQVKLTGIDLVVEQAEIEVSPFQISKAADTRRQPGALAYISQPAAPVKEVSLQGGVSVLEGTVKGPDGPVQNAVVRLERHTDEGHGTGDVRTNADGYWRAEGLLGGRYRVRAWLPGELAAHSSTLLFLGGKEKEDSLGKVAATPLTPEEENEIKQKIDFQLFKTEDEPFIELVDAGPIYINLTGTIAANVSRRTVDADGLVTTEPVPNTIVDLRTSSGVQIVSGATGITNSDGLAYFTLRCRQTGTPSAVLRFGEIERSFPLPECLPKPPPVVVEEIISEPSKNTSANSSVSQSSSSNSSANTTKATSANKTTRLVPSTGAGE